MIDYNLISNTLDKTTLEIDCDKDKFYITINDYKTKYKWKDNKFQINIKLDIAKPNGVGPIFVVK